MNIHEYQAKQLFRDYGIPVPDGASAQSPEQALEIARRSDNHNWVIKAQVHAGARGKAGGVKFASTPEQVVEYTKQLLGTRLVTHQTDAKGLPVNHVLIEAGTAIKNEYYLSLLLDRKAEKLLFVASAAGGMDIEAVAEQTPDKIIETHIHPAAGLQAYQCRKIAKALGLLNKDLSKQLAQIMQGMVNLFIDKDASQIEINPLVETEDGQLLALDAKINFDDNALPAHADIQALRDPEQEDATENKAKQFDLSYVTLDGNIGCMVNGAGLAMATMDLIKLKGGQPANFLDVGGGTDAKKVAEAFKLILSDNKVKAVLVNIFGGIVQCNIIAEGIIAAAKELHLNLPVVVRLEGTNAQEGLELLNISGLGLTVCEDLNQAAERVVALAGEHA
ncbi:ADP-forming succinate--CoA ligase subunit beta [methane-oxidizing endosymbiont of Gigantopelta aegis]|uniref:ADP-forming succinate--CoA ligase subunit beta n=1 Tax=methane-oxidizing endosymbiont of Gigantopelta aegis TaxID=2794938 RepID=UPI0018DC53CA|nr:ADP-forming succinate--CoA ligase subunit beta [methane-oxidizing endosymbiont of Gigantopelta aegis]